MRVARVLQNAGLAGPRAPAGKVIWLPVGGLRLSARDWHCPRCPPAGCAMLTPKYLRFALLLVAAPFAGLADEKTDRQIEETAKSSYTFRRVLNDDIEVKVRHGVATLTGSVPDLDQSRLAEDTVAGIEGVTRVDNQIKLDPKAQGVSDEWLSVKIRSKLLLRRDVSVMNTRWHVKEGVVTLTGTAGSEQEKRRTETVIKEIGGVRQVRNLLEVAERTADAGVRRAQPREEEREEPLPPGAGLPTGRDAKAPPTAAKPADSRGATETSGRDRRDRNESEESPLRSQVEDTAITTRIKFELLTNDDTSGLSTKIATDNGRVVITGEAESEEQRQLVTELARRVQGVTHIDNRMSVRRR